LTGYEDIIPVHDEYDNSGYQGFAGVQKGDDNET
jgi:hypothetical protein